MKTIFATSVTTNVTLQGSKPVRIEHATIERQSSPGFNGVEIVNRSGVKMCLDVDAALGLYVALQDMIEAGKLVKP